MAAFFTPLQPTLGIAHGDHRLVCCCSANETHFMKLPQRTVIVLMLLPEAVWNLVVSVATEDRRFLRATRFSTRRPLPHYSGDFIAPSHFKITAVTVDRGSSSRAEMLWTDVLEILHPMTVPCWKLLSSSVRPFYCQYFPLEIAWPCAGFYTPVSNACSWNSQSTNLKWCPHTCVS
jgi:hypothetical protein